MSIMKKMEESIPIYVFPRRLFYEELRNVRCCILVGVSVNKKVNSTTYFVLI